MIRFALAMALVGGGLLFNSHAHAAHPSESMRPSRSALLGGGLTVPAHRASTTSRATLRDVPRSRSDAPVQQTASGFALADSAFSPAVVQSQYTGVLNNAGADGNPFSLNHTPSSTNQIYENLHRVTGYYERADWNVSGGPITFRYQANVFSDTQAAVNAFLDGVTYTQQANSGANSKDCSNGSVFQCRTIVYGPAGTTLVYATAQYHQCTVEVSIEAPDATYTANQSQAGTTLFNILNAGGSAMLTQCGNAPPPPTQTPVPNQPTATTVPAQPTATPTTVPQTGTEFSIITVRIEPKNTKPDWDLVKPPLERVQSGTEIQASIYWVLRSAPAGSRPSFRFIVTHGGSTVFDQEYKGTLSSYTADTYRFFSLVTLRSAGKYTVQGQVLLNGHVKTDSASVVVQNYAPPPARHISFSFDKLRAVNAKGQAQRTFRAGQVVGISIRYSVNNVNGTVPVRIFRTYQFNSSGGWRPLGRPIVDSFDTASGAHFRNTSFQAPSTVNPLRIVVGITLGSVTKQKNVTIQIRK